jgi:hypothetical protein
VSDSTPPLHYKASEDSQKCKSDSFSVIKDDMEENSLVINYEYFD